MEDDRTAKEKRLGGEEEKVIERRKWPGGSQRMK